MIMLGCSREAFKGHIESRLQAGMTLDNYGQRGWVIDHIRPLASFHMENATEMAAAFHYSNTQPMWATENIQKGDKLPDGSLGRYQRRASQEAIENAAR